MISKEVIKSGSAQHYEWVVSNGRSKIGRCIGFMMATVFIAVVLFFIYVAYFKG